MEIRASNDSTLRFLNGLSQKLDTRSEAIVSEAAELAGESIRLMLSRNGQHARGSRSGHAPVGETPKMETGNLHNSVQVMPARKIGFGQYSAGAAPTAVYAEAVDQGTRYMGARPYMDRARNQAVVEFDRFLSGVTFELVR
jgi:hypothetical protein